MAIFTRKVKTNRPRAQMPEQGEAHDEKNASVPAQLVDGQGCGGQHVQDDAGPYPRYERIVALITKEEIIG